jgi:hypothetical protein
MAKLYGIKAAADHVGVKGRQTILNWVAKGLEHETLRVGKITVFVFESEKLEQFQRDTKHKPGPIPKAE